ncbi:MAG: hypothetical protein OEY23_01180 [Acidimicrobiia bacterium]|nr:hypothetical protein [Acidimicrobiia bacterium]
MKTTRRSLGVRVGGALAALTVSAGVLAGVMSVTSAQAPSTDAASVDASTKVSQDSLASMYSTNGNRWSGNRWTNF